MNLKRTIKISWIFFTISVTVILATYIIYFRNHTISTDPEKWTNTATFFGNLFTPIISLITLIILSYISVYVSKIEGKRNEFTLQELARPLGNFICGDYENLIEIKYRNCGLGPLKIKNISILEDGEIISDNLINIMPPTPENLDWDDFIIDGKNFIVAKDTEINVVRLLPKIGNSKHESYKRKVRERLLTLTLEIDYVDIYNRPMETSIRKLDLYGRTLKDQKSITVANIG